MPNTFKSGFVLTGVLHAEVFARLLFPKVRYIARVFALVYDVFCCVNNCSVLLGYKCGDN